MSQQIVVDSASLRIEGRNMSAVGQDFLAALQTLSGRLESLEQGDTPPWGDDDLGEKFGIVYEGLRDGMKESMDSLGTRIGEIGGKLQSMADSHEATESQNESNIHTLEAREGEVGGQIRALYRPRVY
ncbi:WXG100 family type VII secretion target [Kitasatospora sp. NPDC004615]|uniref:WXG100 family type VII secretion target n=1 Tax=unclassified Kitasatospora TaxID=2633591 RepID=UPI00368F6241